LRNYVDPVDLRGVVFGFFLCMAYASVRAVHLFSLHRLVSWLDCEIAREWIGSTVEAAGMRWDSASWN
jgi:hypothetical protein